MLFMLMAIMKKLGDGSLLAIDGSKIHLPNAPEILTRIRYHKRNVGSSSKIIGRHGYGLAQGCMMFLTRLSLTLVLHLPKAQRKDLALEHIKHTQDGD
jgi:hypothetical protein